MIISCVELPFCVEPTNTNLHIRGQLMRLPTTPDAGAFKISKNAPAYTTERRRGQTSDIELGSKYTRGPIQVTIDRIQVASSDINEDAKQQPFRPTFTEVGGED